jgi:hypothetical protein
MNKRMNKPALFVGLAALLAALLLTAIAAAQTSVSFDLSWHVLTGGGAQTAGTTYAANCTVGQGAIGWTDSGSYGAGVGYWYGATGGYRIFLPLVLKNHS